MTLHKSSQVILYTFSLPGSLPFGKREKERQAKHIVVTRNEIHPEHHEVDTRMTRITSDVGIQLKPLARSDCAERIG